MNIKEDLQRSIEKLSEELEYALYVSERRDSSVQERIEELEDKLNDKKALLLTMNWLEKIAESLVGADGTKEEMK